MTSHFFIDRVVSTPFPYFYPESEYALVVTHDAEFEHYTLRKCGEVLITDLSDNLNLYSGPLPINPPRSLAPHMHEYIYI